MSNLLPSPEAEECTAAVAPARTLEALPSKSVLLGELEVHRVLPVRGRRLIGPWCFFDRFGPIAFENQKPMDVAPHPHIGLQTVTWLFGGEIVHNDSLGSQCLVQPGQLSLMTAGRGISHAEETPSSNSARLDGVQLWVALPEASRRMDPGYQCTGRQEVVETAGGLVTPVMGSLLGAASEGRQFSEGVGVDIAVHPGHRLALPLEPAFEYGVLLASGDASVQGVEVALNTLYYLGSSGGELTVSSREGAKLVLIGGAPFGETVLMWWNFVARSPEEIREARQAWVDHERFGDVRRYRGPRLEAPEFIGRIRK